MPGEPTRLALIPCDGGTTTLAYEPGIGSNGKDLVSITERHAMSGESCRVDLYLDELPEVIEALQRALAMGGRDHVP
jgi:hypothetical protein